MILNELKGQIRAGTQQDVNFKVPTFKAQK